MNIHDLKRYKKDFSYSYTLGFYPTIELVKHKGDKLESLIMSPKAKQSRGLEKLMDVLPANVKPILNDKLIQKLSPKENSYVIGVFTKFEAPLEKGKNHLVLVNPSNAGNLGTIIRTMMAFDITNIAIILPAVDIFDPAVIRASMGSVFSVRFECFNSFKQYELAHQQNFYPFMTDGTNDIQKVAFKSPFSLVFGNESSGLPAEFKEFGTSVFIPQSEKVDSLNLAVSVGIGAYAAMINETT